MCAGVLTTAHVCKSDQWFCFTRQDAADVLEFPRSSGASGNGVLGGLVGAIGWMLQLVNFAQDCMIFCLFRRCMICKAVGRHDFFGIRCSFF